MMQLKGIVVCICEGSAEHAIMDILYKNKALIFSELLEDKVILERSAKSFENKYLNRVFQDKISIIRILDSRRENFKLSKRYNEKVDIVDVVTAPEIELLIILAENKFDDFNRHKNKNKNLKPNEYCRIFLKYKDVKSYEFFYNYFEDIDKLINTIKKYRSHKQLKSGEYLLYDIIKPELLK